MLERLKIENTAIIYTEYIKNITLVTLYCTEIEYVTKFSIFVSKLFIENENSLFFYDENDEIKFKSIIKYIM